MSDPETRPKKILAIASGGGHWVQLLRLKPAFARHETVYVSINEAYREDVAGEKFLAVVDATRWNKGSLLKMAFQLARIVWRERPDYVVSTGAAPGYVGLRLGRWFGAKTIWIDSIANSEELSLSGKKVGRYADLWLTQWPELAAANGPQYAGAVL